MRRMDIQYMQYLVNDTHCLSRGHVDKIYCYVLYICMIVCMIVHMCTVRVHCLIIQLCRYSLKRMVSTGRLSSILPIPQLRLLLSIDIEWAAAHWN